MYTLYGIDAVLRITAALLLLFVGVPALARRRPAELDRLQWFWWCLAAGLTLLTITGQVLAVLNVFNTATLLLAIAVLVLMVRSRVTGRAMTTILHDLYRGIVLFTLNVLEGRINVRRRIRRAIRRLTKAVSGRRRFAPVVLGTTLVVAVAAALRLYRPFVTANLGFSDTYVHLYLFRLLEQGKQVDPAWGPYPRGMHFLLYAIHELTNVDAILLMNFFGPIVGVLMTLAVFDTARRLTGRLTAGIVAGLLFATMVGGASQYFLFGGSMATDRVQDARDFVAMQYRDIPPTSAEFDVLLTVFQRQTATLPQELAVVFLFPAVMFLFRGSSRWHLTGYLFCTSAIAATHPGVAVPLVVLSAITVVLRHPERSEGAQPTTPWRTRFFASLRTTLLAGAAGIALGSTWMFGYVLYPHIGTRDIESARGASSSAMYYFPFLRTGDVARIVTYVAITPFVIACLAIAVALFFRRKRAFAWVALAMLAFLFTHVASRYGLPEIVEVRRNASWLAMTAAILIGVAATMIPRPLRFLTAAIVAAWMITVPLSGVQEKLVNYSGYGATAYAVLEIQRRHEPFTWTLVTYGQEFPMVLGRGFHLAAADFLERYDPADRKLSIPTPYVFIAVEKNPHPFQINTWSTKFSREDVERRLQTWCFLYQLNHRDMRVFLDDANVRVYMIERAL